MKKNQTFKMFSKFYFRFVKIVLILHCILYHNICQVINLQRRKQSSAGYFIQHTNRYLDVPEIDRKKVRNTIHCLQECMKNEQCFSTNLADNPDKNGRLTCQLLPTNKCSASSSFKRREFFRHFSSVVRQCQFKITLRI